MTLTSILNSPAADGMSAGNLHVYTLTTTVDTYEVIGTVQTANLPAMQNYLTAATNNLLFKFEYTVDGTNWVAEVEDYPILAGADATQTAIRNAVQYRVSVKPAVAGSHGTATWRIFLSKVIIPAEYRAGIAYEALTITNAAAVGLTIATAGAATCALVTVEDNPVRVRWDGTAPTTTEGHVLQSGDTLDLDYTADIFHFKAIATGGNAKLRVTYSR